MVEANPTLARRELAVFFSTLREQRGGSLSDVAKVLGVSESQASRVDTGARGIRARDVDLLASWYELSSAETAPLLALAEEARKRAWWQQIDLPNSYRTLIGLEQGARSVYEFDNIVVPGYLQTSQYAKAAASSQTGASDDIIDRTAEVRLRRQEIFRRQDPPDLSVVIDEAVLARGAGGPDVMVGQLDRLINEAKRAEVSIQVIPFAAGTYPGGYSQFILLAMAKGLPDIHYAETLHDAEDTTDPEKLRTSQRLWRTLQGNALSERLSLDMIADYRARYEKNLSS
jgi:transcriptional regulator with XRE-family HTH domain